MPMIPKAPVKRLYLPSTANNEREDERLFIDYKKGVTIGDLSFYDPSATEMEQAIMMLCRIIVAWNVTDESGAEVPINPATVKELPGQDIEALIAIVEEVVPSLEAALPKAEKKT